MKIISIFQIIFSLSLFGIIFIFLRNLPVLVEFEPQPIPREKKFYFRCKKRVLVIKEKLSDKFHQFREKNLHRLKVLTLKMDNFLTSYLKKTREIRLHQKKKARPKTK